MNNFVVIGNPVSHSKSPFIHHCFSKQTGIKHCYGTLLAPFNNFKKSAQNFLHLGGVGANVTLPFKEQAYEIVDELTEQAALAGAVNTLHKRKDGSILGDNTDGIGLLSDLRRLLFIRKYDEVLLIGAGGAARGVIPSLLSFGCILTVTNRTLDRAKKLADSFSHAGKITALSLTDLADKNFNLIINASSSSINGNIPFIPISLISPNTHCYDMFYQKGNTPFLQWCLQAGATKIADGLGMLVEQAARAFFLWYNIFPETVPVISCLQRKMRM